MTAEGSYIYIRRYWIYVGILLCIGLSIMPLALEWSFVQGNYDTDSGFPIFHPRNMHDNNLWFYLATTYAMTLLILYYTYHCRTHAAQCVDSTTVLPMLISLYTWPAVCLYYLSETFVGLLYIEITSDTTNLASATKSSRLRSTFSSITKNSFRNNSTKRGESVTKSPTLETTEEHIEDSQTISVTKGDIGIISNDLSNNSTDYIL
eukprot:Awhi_evm1s1411